MFKWDGVQNEIFRLDIVYKIEAQKINIVAIQFKYIFQTLLVIWNIYLNWERLEYTDSILVENRYSFQTASSQKIWYSYRFW